jgi:hypothetical protein
MGPFSSDLSGHGPTFKWNTKAEVLAAVGHGHRSAIRRSLGTAKAIRRI